LVAHFRHGKKENGLLQLGVSSRDARVHAEAIFNIDEDKLALRMRKGSH